MAKEKDGIFFKYDISQKRFCEISFLDESHPILLELKVPEDLVSTLEFILDYQKSNEVPKPEIIRLTKHMFNKLRYFQNVSIEARLEGAENQPITLRQITYDAVKKILESKYESNLDEMTDIILNSKYPIELKKDSVRASISAIFSALRSCFKDLDVEAWDKPTWRGKSTGRNPYIKVPNNFIMPSYVILWERYGQHLKKEKNK